MKEVILITRKKAIEDLEGSSKNAFRMSNEELEIYYNNEFYLGFEGKEFKILEKEGEQWQQK